MTLVVSDTSPLNYLILIDSEEILPTLFGSLLVPSQVIEELRRDKAPDRVRNWAENLPSWVQVETGDPSRFPVLDYGEAAALAMAIDQGGRLLVDEAQARAFATSLGVPIIGTIGVLAQAHLESLLDFDTAITALASTTYRVHPGVITKARMLIVERQSNSGRPQ